MKTALFALVVAGCCSAASAQTVFFNRSCNPGMQVSYAGNGFAISYGTWSPQMSWGWPVYGGRACLPMAPVVYWGCPQPVIVAPFGTTPRSRTVNFQPARRVVANPVFPAQGYEWGR